MQVEFDTVANNFNITSGTTGGLWQLIQLGVPLAQSASSVAVGRYKPTAVEQLIRPMMLSMHLIRLVKAKIILWVPVQSWGHTSNRLISKPAVSVGGEALMDMTKAFTASSLANENQFTVVASK